MDANDNFFSPLLLPFCLLSSWQLYARYDILGVQTLMSLTTPAPFSTSLLSEGRAGLTKATGRPSGQAAPVRLSSRFGEVSGYTFLFDGVLVWGKPEVKTQGPLVRCAECAGCSGVPSVVSRLDVFKGTLAHQDLRCNLVVSTQNVQRGFKQKNDDGGDIL